MACGQWPKKAIKNRSILTEQESAVEIVGISIHCDIIVGAKYLLLS